MQAGKLGRCGSECLQRHALVGTVPAGSHMATALGFQDGLPRLAWSRGGTDASDRCSASSVSFSTCPPGSMSSVLQGPV